MEVIEAKTLHHYGGRNFVRANFKLATKQFPDVIIIDEFLFAPELLACLMPTMVKLAKEDVVFILMCDAYQQGPTQSERTTWDFLSGGWKRGVANRINLSFPRRMLHDRAFFETCRKLATGEEVPMEKEFPWTGTASEFNVCRTHRWRKGICRQLMDSHIENLHSQHHMGRRPVLEVPRVQGNAAT